MCWTNSWPDRATTGGFVPMSGARTIPSSSAPTARKNAATGPTPRAAVESNAEATTVLDVVAHHACHSDRTCRCDRATKTRAVNTPSQHGSEWVIRMHPVPVRGNQRIRRRATHAIMVLVRAYTALAMSGRRQYNANRECQRHNWLKPKVVKRHSSVFAMPPR